jgi:hypothetical protein
VVSKSIEVINKSSGSVSKCYNYKLLKR